MARSPRGKSGGAKPPASAQPTDEAASVTPAPPATLTDLPKGQVLHRVHQEQYRADQFNRVEHDQSKNLLTYHDLLQNYIDHDEAITFRQTEIADITFRLSLPQVSGATVSMGNRRIRRA